MTWLLGIGKVAIDFIRGLPWQVWAVIAVIALGLWYGERRHDTGVMQERARWQEAQRKADEKARAALARRDKAADGINTTTAQRGASTAAATRAETAGRAERIEHESRKAPIPAGCPTGLPDGVRAELARAAERTAAAGNSLRAGDDTRP